MKYVYYIIAVLFLVACHTESSPDVKVFKYSEFNKVTSLDPAFARSNSNMWIVNQIYDGLLLLDDSLNIQPCIAKHWEVSEDALNYRFTLRDDVYFHPSPCFSDTTRRVTADDVVYSFQRIIEDSIASPGSWIFKGRVDESNPFEAENDSVFVLRLKSPFVPILGILAMQYCNIVPHEAVAHYGNRFRSNPVGTGPFKFKRWIENQALFLNKYDHYYMKGYPRLDGVKISMISDRKIAFLELLNGNLDYFSGLESSFINELLTKEGNLQTDKEKEVDFNKAPYLNFEYLGFNMESSNGLYRNKKLRQALNYAIDRETMLSVLRNSIGVPADAGAIPRGLPSHRPYKNAYTYRPDTAKALIQSVKEELSLSDISLTLTSNNDYLDLTTFVANQWKKVGVDTEIEVVESAVLRDAMRKGSVDLFRASWIADYPDGENFLCLFYSGNPAPPNYTRYRNPVFDDLYEKSIIEEDDALRYDLYDQMNKLLLDDPPVIFLFYDQKAQFTSKRVKNMSKNAINMLDLTRVELAD